MTRMHLDATPEGSAIARAACGWFGSFETTTRVNALVSCKLCMRTLTAAPEYTPAPTPTLLPPAPRLELARDPSEPPLYVVTRERWEDAHRYRGEGKACTCKRCDTCKWFVRCDSDYALANTYEQASGLYEPERPRWSSVAEALTDYVRHLEDGYPAPSLAYERTKESDGWLALRPRANADSPAGTGPRIDSRSERVADETVAVDGALRAVYGRQQDPIRYGAWLTVLLGRVVGQVEERRRKSVAYRVARAVQAEDLAAAVGIEVKQVGTIVRSAMRGLRVELGARGLVRLRRDVGLEAEVRFRRAELEQRRTA